MGLSLSTDQTSQAVLYEEVKRYMRLDHDEDQRLIEDDLIPDAERYLETFLNISIMQKEYVWTLPQFPASNSRLFYPLVFPKNPLIDTGNLTVQYYTGGSLTTFASSNYELITDRAPNQLQLLEGKSFPSTDDRDDAVQITFKAGVTNDYKTVPKDVKNAISMIVWSMFDNTRFCGPMDLNKALLACIGNRKLYDPRIFLYVKPQI